MLQAFYVRNDQETLDGGLKKWNLHPDWMERMKRGENPKLDYEPGDAVVVVNKTPEEFPVETPLTQVAGQMFHWYNRKGFDDREFEGPSMSVGDLVVIRNGADVTVLQVLGVGFKQLETTPELLCLGLMS